MSGRTSQQSGRPTVFSTIFTASCIIFLLTFSPGLTFASQILDLDGVTERALENSHDVKLSSLDIHISRSMQKRAYSLYYPTFNARWNSEYVKDLSGGAPQVTAIGDTIISESTYYHNSLSVAASYNLFDFGSTRKKVFIAKKDVDVKMMVYIRQIRDIKIKVLNLYTDLLTSRKELEAKKELLSLYKELSLTKERLYFAGAISKIEMVDEALSVVKTLEAIDNLELRLKTVLQDLSFYTGEDYDANSVKVQEFEGCEQDYENSFNPEKSPEFRMYALEIEKKKAELDILKRERFPQFGLYSRYVWYGQDRNNYEASVNDIRDRNYFIGISATLPIFEGFKTNAEMEKTALEIERLKVEKQKKLAELINRHAKLNETRVMHIRGLENQKDMLAKVEEKLSMTKRLAEQNVADLIELLNRRIELINQRLELTKTMITKVATIKELQMLSEGVN
ncbi:MAG: TolC family protein [Proteobacteria bacterium]|nr:TolC family protein [Pseudomonadota bacterium]